MSTEEGNEPLSETRRKDIFLALVDAQDQKVAVAESRKLMIDRFHVTERDVRQIEREGMEKQWPPLD